MTKVVIVGGGFAGIKAARNLSCHPDYHVVLISDRTNFEYHAALYRTATGRSPLEVVVPLAEIFADCHNVEVVEDRAASIDTKKKQLISEDGCTYSYDTLILALGAVTTYFGINGMAEYSYGIKSIHESLELKRHLHDQLIDPSKPDVDYVVVGGGPTGVELAGEMAVYLKHIYAHHNLAGKYFQVSLVEAAPRILPVLHEKSSQIVSGRLAKLGVKLFTGTAVQGETADQLLLPTGPITTHTVVWTAGVAANSFFKANEKLFKLGKGGRVEVDAELKGAKDIYVLGDSAATTRTGWAQTALYDADFVTDNLMRTAHGKAPKPYNPKEPVGAIPVGPNWSLVQKGDIIYYSYLGWITRRLFDFKLMVGLLPFGLAVRSWLSGTRVDEQMCPVCRH